jgi:hypothetical protein
MRRYVAAVVSPTVLAGFALAAFALASGVAAGDTRGRAATIAAKYVAPRDRDTSDRPPRRRLRPTRRPRGRADRRGGLDDARGGLDR